MLHVHVKRGLFTNVRKFIRAGVTKDNSYYRLKCRVSRDYLYTYLPCMWAWLHCTLYKRYPVLVLDKHHIIDIIDHILKQAFSNAHWHGTIALLLFRTRTRSLSKPIGRDCRARSHLQENLWHVSVQPQVIQP